MRVSGKQVVEELPGVALRQHHHRKSEVNNVYRAAVIEIPAVSGCGGQ
jgi:hypothetical protein